ncbi:MAG: HDIG domain-containing protein [Candidatus Azobacteroides sp.]|nr:HDIG domain-containing protein [Candidatus Azobacteroides sp.]
MRKKLHNVPVFIYFIIITLLIVFLFPREGKFKYVFIEGKPWRYGLLTAPLDFPIYKIQSEFKREQDSIARSFEPYFLFDKNVIENQLGKFVKNRSNYPMITNTYALYIEKSLRKVYEQGIVSVSDYEFLRGHNYSGFMVIHNNIASRKDVGLLFTVRSAYSYILSNIPAYLNIEILSSISIDSYLTENLKYDEETSVRIKNGLLSQVSPSIGMVQAGEKIIDRGEIVDNKTYNILSSLRQVIETRSKSVQAQGWVLVGVFLQIAIIMTFLYLFVYFFRRKIYENNKDMFFLFSLIGFFTIITALCVNYQLFNVYIIPYAIIPIVIRTFFDSRTACSAHNMAILMCSLMVPSPFEFIILQFSTSMVVIYSLNVLTKRSQLIRCSFFILLTYIVIYLGLVLFMEGDISKINWRMFVYFGINFIFLMFTYALIYIIESIFGYVSGVTLVELSDINTPVLRKLSEIAPGTFQHSLQVSILGSAVAEKVGANPLLIRTGALYHDVGKIENPGYFIENQVGDNNPHHYLPYEKSAQIILKHVPDGIKLAEKYNLPEMLIDFIRTHHGAGVTKYFYNSYRNEFPDAPVDLSKFAYPGPNPSTKEESILMMADAVEAASRSLKDYSEESITELVDRIINSQIAEGLLADTPLTFKDIKIIKTIFIEKLINTFHSRISYPELEK